MKNYCTQSVIDQVIGDHQKPILFDRDLIEVRSGFNGAELYKADRAYDCEYSDANETCEYVSFHLCIREKHQGRIFINPEFLVN